MRRYRHLSSSARVVAKNKLLTVAIIILVVLQVWNVIDARNARDSQRTIVHPVGASHGYELTGTSAGHIYLDAMAHYIADLLLNYHSETIQQNIETLLTLYSDSSRNNAKEYFSQIVSQIIALGYSSTFYISEISHAKESNTMIIAGRQYRRAAEIPTVDEQQRYEVQYRIIHGRFEIQTISRLHDKEQK